MSLPKTYTAREYEDAIYKKWEKSGCFQPQAGQPLADNSESQSFSIAMPPPNATGVLHVGHALGIALEDILVRYHRLRGEKTLWLPGVDHAAIATQNVVEKLLKKEGSGRHRLGREKFLARVEKYVAASRSTIENQTRKMGASCDWSRENYTLGPELSRAVALQFKKMYEDGLVYRGDRVVNWCPRCHSTLSDDEVEHIEQKTKLYWIKYGPFVLATTRPETKLGDTAVAVHPDDKRYQDKVGKKFMIPGVLGEFEITVVADYTVDKEFGSGAIKVTPAHSFVDAEIAERHHLASRQIIDEDGRMMANCGKYAGMKTVEAREAIVTDMAKMGLIDHIDENYAHNLSVCYRCQTPIEPLPSLQWFVAVDKEFELKHGVLIKKFGKKSATLKEISKWAVESGEIEIIPERFKKIYHQWMDNLHDWCISRQIWFGHRIPVWYKTLKNENTKTIQQAPVELNFSHKEIFDLIKQGKKTVETRALNPEEPARYFGNIKAGDSIIFNYKADNKIKEKLLVKISKVTIYQKSEDIYKDYSIDEIYPDHTREELTDFIASILGYAGKLEKNGIIVLELKDISTREPLASAELFVGLEKPTGDGWTQDEDTLDTWFSSALWTWSTLLDKKNFQRYDNLEDWAKASPDLKDFHPTSVMETMHDILFFWVARMVMMTLYALNQIPFKTVYLHSMVCDERGKKMSKSRPETCIEPIKIAEKYGTDAFRLSLVIGNTPGSPLRLSEQKIASYRNFVNKLWNIGRFMDFQAEQHGFVRLDEFIAKTLADQWILSRLNYLIKEVTADLDNYRFSMAGEKLYDFTWHALADWYIEIAKLQSDQNTFALLNHVYISTLKLLHPFTPFVTEKIYEYFGTDKMLMTEKWPSADEHLINPQIEENFGLMQELIVAIRAWRKDHNIDPKNIINLQIAAAANPLKDELVIINILAKTKINIVPAMVRSDFEVKNLKVSMTT